MYFNAKNDYENTYYGLQLFTEKLTGCLVVATSNPETAPVFAHYTLAVERSLVIYFGDQKELNLTKETRMLMITFSKFNDKVFNYYNYKSFNNLLHNS